MPPCRFFFPTIDVNMMPSSPCLPRGSVSACFKEAYTEGTTPIEQQSGLTEVQL